jgi:hypothetical protein
MSNEAVAHVLNDWMIPIAATSLSRARAGRGFHFGPPTGTFSPIKRQKNRRLCFAGKELEGNWSNVLLTEQSSRVFLGNILEISRLKVRRLNLFPLAYSTSSPMVSIRR